MAHSEKTLVISSYIAVSPHHPITASIATEGGWTIAAEKD